MDDRGRIHESTPERIRQLEAANEKREAERAAGASDKGPRRIVSLTDEQAEFFKKKGPAFRSLWAKKMAKGLTPLEAAQLDSLLASEKLAARVRIERQDDLYVLHVPGRAPCPLTIVQMAELEEEMQKIVSLLAVEDAGDVPPEAS